MKRIILFAALLSTFFAQAQEKFVEVKPNDYPIYNLTGLEYIGNGVATWLYGGELYQLTVDGSNGVSTKKIANSGINLQRMQGFDFNADGNKDLFVSRSSSYADGVLRYRYENGEFKYAGNQNYIDDSNLQYIGDYNNDGIDDCIYNNHVLTLKDDSDFSVIGKAASTISQIKSPLFFDIDEDGENEVLYYTFNGLAYSEDEGEFNFGITTIFSGSGYRWIRRINTEDGPKVLFQRDDSVYELVKNGEVLDSIWVAEGFSSNSSDNIKVVNVRGDENEEIVGLLNSIYVIEYIGDGNFRRVGPFSASGSKATYLIDDQEKVKIVGINQGDIDIYEFDDELELKLAVTIENQIISEVDHFGDLNGDGYVDIIGENNFQSYIGGEEFGALSHLELPNNFMKFKDIDGDGDDDYYSNVSWHENLGNGVFGPKQANPDYVPLEYLDIEIWFTQKIASADLDNDGDIDHLSYNNFGEDFLLYENNDDLSYSDPIVLAESPLVSGDRIRSMVSDFNNDGLLDIIMITASGIVYFHNEGGLNFTATENLHDADARPKSVDIRDGNGDGYLDVLVGTIYISGGSATGELVFCLGGPQGIQEAQILDYAGPHDEVLFGLNESGTYDLYSSSWDKLWRFRSPNGYQNFIKEDIVPEGSGSHFIIRDLDNDSDIDIILYNDNSSSISYFLKNENFEESLCPYQDQILRSQSQVNEYEKNYGRCEVLDYSLTIRGDDDWSDITDMSAFSNLKTINGDLEFIRINKDDSFEGFESLEKIEGDFSMELIKHEDFTGFSSLKEIGGDFKMERCWPILGFSPAYDFNDFVSFEKLGGGIEISFSRVENVDKLITGNSIGGNFILNQNTFLQDMEIHDLSKLNQIESIDGTFALENVIIESGNFGLSNLTNISGDFRINSKDNFTSIDDLEDDLVVGGEWVMSYNPNLTSCNVLPLCRHIAKGGRYRVSNNGSDCYDTEDIDCIDNKLAGVAFFDFEKDGIYDSATDGLLSSVLIEYNDEDPILTNGFGQYSIYPLEDEDVTITANLSNDWIPTTETSYEVPSFVPGQSNNSDLNFGFTSVEELNAFEGFMSFSNFVCNESFYARLNIKNKSTQISNGKIRIHYNEHCALDPTYTDYSLHDEVERFVEVPFEDIYPFFEENYSIPFLAPDELQVGNPNIRFKYEILVDQSDNESELVDEQESSLELLCSYDPNDKLVSTTDNSGNIRVNSDDRLYFTIRFQNTGNYYASDVRLEDEISDNLNLSTFELISASHDVSIRIQDRKVIFYFDDIDLIESDENFLESQGYVTFSIMPNSYVLDDIFENQASIFFDQNSPIITNIATSVVYDPLVNTKEIKSNKLNVYPVPSSERLFISTDKATNQQLNYEIYNLSGHKILNGQIFNQESILIDEIVDGMYTIMITSENVSEVLISKFIKTSP